MILPFVFLLQQGSSARAHFCNVVSISSVGASMSKSQIHSWKHKQKQTTWLRFSILTGWSAAALKSIMSKSCITSHKLLQELMHSLMLVCYQFSSSSISTDQGIRVLIRAFLCPGDPICKNHPGSCWSIVFLWTNAHSPQYYQAP